jgi:hypothetical protein
MVRAGRRGNAVVWMLGALALAALLAPAHAHAIPFGADLNLPANVAFDCTVLPLPNAFGNGFAIAPSGQPTCTWMAVGTAADPRQGSLLVPVAGTVTAVQVRVGPITGPMQVVVLRSFRDTQAFEPSVCCMETARTPVFTPTPNAVTTIQTALAVRKDVVPDPNNQTTTVDSLALSVLAPNVPVPLFDTGIHDPSNFGAPSALVYHPAVGPGQERYTNSGVGGFQVLLAADVTPSASGQGPTVGPLGTGPQPTAPAAIRLVQPAVSVRNGVAPILVRCDLATGQCTGVLRLQSRQAGAAAATATAPAATSAGARRRHAGRRGAGRARPRRRPARRPPGTVTYGSAIFDVAAGAEGTVRVRLTRAGRRLLRRSARARVWVNATVAGRPIAPARLTLER